MSHWHLYLIRCRDGSLYTGITTDVKRRFQQHQKGRGAKYLRSRGPLQLVFHQPVGDHALALKVERKVKRWPKSHKEQLLHDASRLQALIVKTAVS